MSTMCVDVLDVDRALLDARAARGARPQHVCRSRRPARAGCTPSAARRCRSRWRRPAAGRATTPPLDASPSSPCVASGDAVRAATVAIAFSASPSWSARARRNGALASAWSRSVIISSLGESGFSVFQAGHCDWQRPHSVHVEKSSRPFQVKSSTAPTPSASPSSSSSMALHVEGLAADRDRLRAPRARCARTPRA